MDISNFKCVAVIDGSLPRGIIANTAAILGISLGSQAPEVVGADVYNKSGFVHSGIIEFPVPILTGTPEVMKDIRQRLLGGGFEDIFSVDFSDTAQSCKTYGEFIERLSRTEESDLRYFGIGLCGDKEKITRLTGNLPLLR